MIFFYEILFVIVAVAAIVLGDRWGRTPAVLFLLAWLAFVSLGYVSFGARVALDSRVAQPSAQVALGEEDKLWYQDARAGLRHLQLLLALALVAAVVWRVVAGP